MRDLDGSALPSRNYRGSTDAVPVRFRNRTLSRVAWSLKLVAACLAMCFVAACTGTASWAPSGDSSVLSDTIQPNATIRHFSTERLCNDTTPGVFNCQAILRPDTLNAVSPGAALTPADLQLAYKLPSATKGKGRLVAIVDAYNNPDAEVDMDMYRAYFKLPPCTSANGCFRKLNASGQTSNYPAANENWAVEEALDVEMVSAVCPNCHIALIEARTDRPDDFVPAMATAASLKPDVISNSYLCQAAEVSGNECPPPNSAYDYPGIVITAAGGDNGYGFGYPAGFSSVVAVGGTTLQRANNARGWTERVWSGTGSGCTGQTKPRWQHDVECGLRMDNDVSAVADPDTGLAIFTKWLGGWATIGGTSAATPIIASVYALAGNAAKMDAAESLYAKASRAGLNDITVGTNVESGTQNCVPPKYDAYWCNAQPGYDGPSGNGTPNGLSAF